MAPCGQFIAAWPASPHSNHVSAFHRSSRRIVLVSSVGEDGVGACPRASVLDLPFFQQEERVGETTAMTRTSSSASINAAPRATIPFASETQAVEIIQFFAIAIVRGLDSDREHHSMGMICFDHGQYRAVPLLVELLQESNGSLLFTPLRCAGSFPTS